jgi:uridine kinase
MTAAQLASLLSGTEPHLGGTRLIAVDGRSGSGKTWLAGQLATPLGAPVIHMDDLYPGWDGLDRAAGVLAGWVIEPLSRGEPARWRRFDWDSMSYGGWHTTDPAGVVLVEGCGSVRAALAAAYAARIWVDAPAAARQRRLRARPDFVSYQPHAQRWAELEDQLYRTEQTRRHCDIIVDNPQPAAHGGLQVSLRLPDGTPVRSGPG